MTVRHIFEISEDDHPRLVTHARDHWWTLDFANAFLSPGVNSRAELEPSPRAYAARWLGDYVFAIKFAVTAILNYLETFLLIDLLGYASFQGA